MCCRNKMAVLGLPHRRPSPRSLTKRAIIYFCFILLDKLLTGCSGLSRSIVASTRLTAASHQNIHSLSSRFCRKQVLRNQGNYIVSRRMSSSDTCTSSFTVSQIPCLSDNYGYLIHSESTGETAAVDTPDAEAYKRELNKRGWKLTHIFNTHQ